MKLLFENFRNFLNEGWDDDIVDMLDDIDNQKKAAKAGAKSWKAPSTEADWEKFKQWKTADSGEGQSPEDFEKAKSQRAEQKPSDTVLFNCKEITKWTSSTKWKKAGVINCDMSLQNATQGLKEGEGPPSNVFKDSKISKFIGDGYYGVVFLLDNGHLVKIFWGGLHGGLIKELQTYAKLLNSQYGGSARAHDLTVYEFGTIPVFKSADDDNPKPHVSHFGYAEVGKVVPWTDYLLDNYDYIGDIDTFFDTDLEDGLSSAAKLSRHRVAKGTLEDHNIRPFDMIKGGAEEYADYVIKWINLRGLEKHSKFVQSNGWAGTQSEYAEKDDWWTMPAIPPELTKGKGKNLLRDFLIAMYDLAIANNDQYIYGHATRDVHSGNFGVSYQTGKIIIFDR